MVVGIKMTSLNVVGLATLSLGFITAAYYILPSVSRYFRRIFSPTTGRESRREGQTDSPAAICQDFPSSDGGNQTLRKTINGALGHATKPGSCLKNGLNVNIHHKVASFKRNGFVVPDDFEKFVGYDMIMKFEGQRQVKFQFFVVVLVSEDDLRDLQHMTFHPHNHTLSQLPLINNQNLSMPEPGNYGNYIVARFESCAYHSEEVVFGPKYDNPFHQLWLAYTDKNGGRSPKAILLYSWNFPCSRCTKLIVGELSKKLYSDSHVMLAYSRIWDSEEGYPHVADTNKEAFRSKIGAYIYRVEPPVELKKAGSSST